MSLGFPALGPDLNTPGKTIPFWPSGPLGSFSRMPLATVSRAVPAIIPNI